MASASSPELDLKCWNILRQYATTGMMLFEAEQELESVFKDSIYAYDDSKWRRIINQIICLEPDTDDGAQIINIIDEAIESLVMETYSQSTHSAPSPLLTSPPLPLNLENTTSPSPPSPPPPDSEHTTSPLPSHPPSNSENSSAHIAHASTGAPQSSAKSKIGLKEWAIRRKQMQESNIESVPAPMAVDVATPTPSEPNVAVVSSNSVGTVKRVS